MCWFKGDGTKLSSGAANLKIVADLLADGLRAECLQRGFKVSLSIEFSPRGVYAIQWAIDKAALLNLERDLISR